MKENKKRTYLMAMCWCRGGFLRKDEAVEYLSRDKWDFCSVNVLSKQMTYAL